MTRAVSLLVAGLMCGCAAQSVQPAVSFIADFNVAPGTRFEALDTESLGGISAIAYDESSGHWLALSDARRLSRLYELAVVYDGRTLDVRPVAITRFYDRSGESFADNVLDPEGLAETPWGTLLISTEPDARIEPVEQAKLLEFDTDGRILRQLELPPKFVVEGSPPQNGLRHNLGFESLTLSVDGTRLFLGGEMSLLQDGPEVTFERPAYCRIVEYRVSESTVVPVAELAYPLGPLAPVDGFGDADPSAGLVELAALDDHRLLALERDFIRERSGERRGVNRARLFLVDIEGASDVSSIASLATDRDFIPVKKELLLDFDDIVSELSPEFQRLDNFEAMGLGPVLPDGGRSLLVVSDDNFRDAQRTAFLLFSLKAVNE